MPSKAVSALKTAAKGLLYSSESDEPFEVLEWKREKGPLNAERLQELGAHDPATPVKSVPLDAFFKHLTTEHKWHDDKERAAVKRYRNLMAVVKEYLANAQVFRVGESWGKVVGVAAVLTVEGAEIFPPGPRRTLEK